MTTAPGPPPKIYLDIDAALRRDDVASAVTLARRAIDQGMIHPMLFDLRAFWHESSGRFPAACADLERALTLMPGDARFLNRLGRCRTENGQLAEAVAACRAAIAAEPTLAAAHYNEAFAYEQLGELELAWQAYSRAARLDPAMRDATARLASLAARRGDHAEARALADRVLAVEHNHAVAAFAHVVSDLAEGKFADAEVRARRAMDDPNVVPQARINAASFVADALDGQNKTAEAFEFYRRSKDGLKTLFSGRFEGAGRETGSMTAQRLMREFEASSRQTRQSRVSTPEGDAAGVVFLMGFPRSGTTLLGQVLGAHSRVVTIEEKPLLGEAMIEFIHKPGGLARLAALSEAEIMRYRALFWEHVENEGVQPRGKFVVDQSPLNSLHLPVIAALFPEAKIVFALRDPRDVVLSCFRRLFALNAYVYEFLTLDGTARFYDLTMKLFTLYRDKLALTVGEVKNEDLIADFDGQTRLLCEFLGLPPDNAMADFAARARSRRIATPSAMQVSRGLRSDGVGHWKNYARELAPILPIVAPWVERFGYA